VREKEFSLHYLFIRVIFYSEILYFSPSSWWYASLTPRVNFEVLLQTFDVCCLNSKANTVPVVEIYAG